MDNFYTYHKKDMRNINRNNNTNFINKYFKFKTLSERCETDVEKNCKQTTN